MLYVPHSLDSGLLCLQFVERLQATCYTLLTDVRCLLRFMICRWPSTWNKTILTWIGWQGSGLGMTGSGRTETMISMSDRRIVTSTLFTTYTDTQSSLRYLFKSAHSCRVLPNWTSRWENCTGQKFAPIPTHPGKNFFLSLIIADTDVTPRLMNG